jgi:GPH family glycoside/pentoside/hexuronide:cation symporter
MKETTTPKLPFGVKLGYGAAEFANSLTWTMVFVILLYFLTDIVGISPSFAGFILMIGRVWDAVVDPIVGVWTDSTRCRYGRRRPFILAVAIPFGIVTWLLFTRWPLTDAWTKVYFTVMGVLFFTLSTTLDVPHTALAAEMTQDYNERTSLVGYRAFFSQVSSIVASAVPWVLVAWLTKTLGSRSLSWSLMTGAFGIVSVFFILWTWRATRGRELFPEKTVVHLRDITGDVLRNGTFLFTVGIYTFSNVALSLGATVMVYYMIYYLGFDDTQQSIAFLFLFACTILWIPLINLFSKKWGKRAAFVTFIGLWAVVQAAGGMLIRPGQEYLFYAMAALASGGVVSVTMLGWSMILDVVEVDEFKTGQRREGLYFSLCAFARKVGVAAALWGAGAALELIGYVKEQPQAETTIFWLRVIYALGTGLFLFVSIALAWGLPMTRRRHEALRAAIEAKKSGRAYDEESIRMLL